MSDEPILTEDDVRQIRRFYAMGVNQYELAEVFEVAQTIISRIVRRAGWKHVI